MVAKNFTKIGRRNLYNRNMTITLTSKTKKYFLSSLVNVQDNESFVIRLLTTDNKEPSDKKYVPAYINSFDWEISGQKMITALSLPQIFMFEGGSKETVNKYFVETINQRFLFEESIEPISINSGGSIQIRIEMELK